MFVGFALTAYTAADVLCNFPNLHWPMPDMRVRTLTGRDSWSRLNRAKRILHRDKLDCNRTNNILSMQFWMKNSMEKARPPYHPNFDRKLWSRYNNVNELRFDVSVLVNYFIHEPSIVLWQRNAEAQFYQYKLVFVVELDVIFIGDFTTFFKTMEQKSDAAAAEGDVFYAVAIEDAWIAMKWMYNDRFLHKYLAKDKTASTSTHHKWEHVEIFSNGFLSLIEEELKHGVAAHGEEFASTVCMRADGCRLFDLTEPGYSKEFLSMEDTERFVRCIDSLHSALESTTRPIDAKFCEALSPNGKFYHKFAQDVSAFSRKEQLRHYDEEVCRVIFHPELPASLLV